MTRQASIIEMMRSAAARIPKIGNAESWANFNTGSYGVLIEKNTINLIVDTFF